MIRRLYGVAHDVVVVRNMVPPLHHDGRIWISLHTLLPSYFLVWFIHTPIIHNDLRKFSFLGFGVELSVSPTLSDSLAGTHQLAFTHEPKPSSVGNYMYLDDHQPMRHNVLKIFFAGLESPLQTITTHPRRHRHLLWSVIYAITLILMCYGWIDVHSLLMMTLFLANSYFFSIELSSHCNLLTLISPL